MNTHKEIPLKDLKTHLQHTLAQMRAWDDTNAGTGEVEAALLVGINSLSVQRRGAYSDTQDALDTLVYAHHLFILAVGLKHAETNPKTRYLRNSLNLARIIGHEPIAGGSELREPVNAVLTMLESHSPDGESVVDAVEQCISNHVRFPEEKEPDVAPLTACASALLQCILLRRFGPYLTDSTFMRADYKGEEDELAAIKTVATLGPPEEVLFGKPDIGQIEAVRVWTAGKDAASQGGPPYPTPYPEVGSTFDGKSVVADTIGMQPVRTTETTSMQSAEPNIQTLPKLGIWQMDLSGEFVRLVAACPECGKFAHEPLAIHSNGGRTEWMCPDAECGADEYEMHLGDLKPLVELNLSEEAEVAFAMRCSTLGPTIAEFQDKECAVGIGVRKLDGDWKVEQDQDLETLHHDPVSELVDTLTDYLKLEPADGRAEEMRQRLGELAAQISGG